MLVGHAAAIVSIVFVSSWNLSYFAVLLSICDPGDEKMDCGF